MPPVIACLRGTFDVLPEIAAPVVARVVLIVDRASRRRAPSVSERELRPGIEGALVPTSTCKE